MFDPVLAPVVAAQDLAIGYCGRRQPCRLLAEGIDLRLDPGELVCLLGPNGAGKSTLLRTLAGLQRPLRGRVQLGADDLHRLPPRALARQLSVVLTDRAEVGALTVRALVALGRYPYTDWSGRLTPGDWAAIDQALAAVGATGLAERFVGELSDGERQKALIARALAQTTRLLLLDEPTAFLDLPRRVEIMSILRRLVRETGQAVLMSTHDLDLALRAADRLWLLPIGGPVRCGIPEELVLDGAFQATFPSDAVTFDAASGHFELHGPTRGQIVLVGEGLPALWTRRALEREGYLVCEPGGPRSAVQVEVCHRSGQSLWRIHQGGSAQDYPGLSQAMGRVKAGLEALDRH